MKTRDILPFPIRSVNLLSREQLSMLIDTAFWASLQFNEGRATRFCVCVADPADFNNAVAFATPVPYDVSQIEQLAPAAPLGGCLVVSGSGQGLDIWGFGRKIIKGSGLEKGNLVSYTIREKKREGNNGKAVTVRI
jgi:hypothetical protein